MKRQDYLSIRNQLHIYVVSLMLWCGGGFVSAVAQDIAIPDDSEEPTTILIRNVRLIDQAREPETEPAPEAELAPEAEPEPEAELKPETELETDPELETQPDSGAAAETNDVIVNLLIRNGELDIVTLDEISTEEADLTVDAQNGFLLGALEIGQPPSFLILDQDPRENFEVLLDTATYARFAIQDGRIVRNTFVAVADVEPEPADEPRLTRWLAYTPPPMVLPLSFQDTTQWNKWETSHVSGIFAGGVVLDRQNWVSQDDASKPQLGDLEDFDGGEIRGLRFGVVGTLNFETPWVYTIFAATNAFDKGFDIETTDDFTFFDYRLDIPVFRGTTLSIGKQKEPISMERLMSLTALPMQERTSVSDALLPSRNVGAVLNGAGVGERMTWAGGVFNDWIETGGSFGNSATQVIGRVTWLPFISDDESNLLHLGLGLRYTNAEEGIRFGTEPEFNQAPDFVDTGVFAANSSTTYNIEASWRKGPFWVAGEYVNTAVDSPNFGDPNFGGYHLTGSWALTGEMRTYNRRSGLLSNVPVAQSVYQGGWGTWELGVRWSELDLTDGLIDGGEMEILSVGVNWWLTPVFGVSANVRHISLDRAGISSDSVGFMSRLVLLLE